VETRRREGPAGPAMGCMVSCKGTVTPVLQSPRRIQSGDSIRSITHLWRAVSIHLEHNIHAQLECSQRCWTIKSWLVGEKADFSLTVFSLNNVPLRWHLATKERWFFKSAIQLGKTRAIEAWIILREVNSGVSLHRPSRTKTSLRQRFHQSLSCKLRSFASMLRYPSCRTSW